VTCQNGLDPLHKACGELFAGWYDGCIPYRMSDFSVCAIFSAGYTRAASNSTYSVETGSHYQTNHTAPIQEWLKRNSVIGLR
jgi:hypothetical protein